eukprot:m.3967 g.3967  ORF g.3967 m.3967 type:complete len:78 (-) comp6635_c0_seq1:142-375(-)
MMKQEEAADPMALAIMVHLAGTRMSLASPLNSISEVEVEVAGVSETGIEKAKRTSVQSALRMARAADEIPLSIYVAW